MTSTKGCRLRATDPHIMRGVGSTGVTGGYVDPGTVSTRGKRRKPKRATIGKRGMQRAAARARANR